MNSKTWHYRNARVGVGNGNRSGVLSKQGVATNGRNQESQMHQRKTNQVAGTEKVLAQYPQYFTLPPLVRADSEDSPSSPKTVRKQSEESEDSPRTVRAESEHYYSNCIFYSARTLLGLCSDFARNLLRHQLRLIFIVILDIILMSFLN